MSKPATPIPIAELAARIQAVEAGAALGPWEKALPVATGWGQVAKRAVHEWFAELPPMGLMIDVAQQAAAAERGVVFWVGRSCWPYVPALEQGAGEAARLLRRSVFVDVPSRQSGARVWALDLILRSPAALAVMADGREMDMAASRRVQLAAEAGSGLAMLWRKEAEVGAISVAHYRWRAAPVPSPGPHPRWQVEQLRCKDAAARARGGSPQVSLVEHQGAKGVIAIPADMADRSRATEAPHAAQRSA